MAARDDSPSAKRQLLGEILVGRNLITENQLKEALRIQEKDKGFLGEILLKMGYLEERDLVVALVVQCNLPYIAVDKYEIDRKIISLIPKDFAKKHHLIALDRVGDILSVVMQDPLDTSVKAEMARMTNCRIAPFISTKKEIDSAIDHFYGEE